MKKKQNKGQAALEYLMTYGFALVIIAIVVGVLIFMGIIALPSAEMCSGLQYFAYEDHTMDYNGYFSLYLANGSGYKLTELDASFGGDFTGSATVDTNTVLEGNFFKVSGQTTKKAGDNYRGEITVGYKRGRYGKHYEKATCIGRASPKPTGTTAFDVDENTVALWHFNEGAGNNLFDSTSNHNDGLISGASWVDEGFKSSLRFDGVDDYVQVNYTPPLLTPPDLTVEAWIKREPGAVGKLVWRTNGYDRGYDLVILDSAGYNGNAVPEHLSASFGHYLMGNIWGDEYYDNGEEDPNPMPENAWQYIAVTFKQGSPLDAPTGYVKLYRNGAVVSEGFTHGYGYYTGWSGIFYIGNSSFHGTIDEVRISNKARTPGEIADTWNRAQQLID